MATWLYHKTEGAKLFKDDEEAFEAVKNGWVDTPAKFDEAEKPSEPDIKEWGAKEDEEIAKDEADVAFLETYIELFVEDAKGLNKEDHIKAGEILGVKPKLNKRHSEATMIQTIKEALNDRASSN